MSAARIVCLLLCICLAAPQAWAYPKPIPQQPFSYIIETQQLTDTPSSASIRLYQGNEEVSVVRITAPDITCALDDPAAITFQCLTSGEASVDGQPFSNPLLNPNKDDDPPSRGMVYKPIALGLAALRGHMQSLYLTFDAGTHQFTPVAGQAYEEETALKKCVAPNLSNECDPLFLQILWRHALPVGVEANPDQFGLAGLDAGTVAFAEHYYATNINHLDGHLYLNGIAAWGEYGGVYAAPAATIGNNYVFRKAASIQADLWDTFLIFGYDAQGKLRYANQYLSSKFSRCTVTPKKDRFIFNCGGGDDEDAGDYKEALDLKTLKMIRVK